jgi:plastocyanin
MIGRLFMLSAVWVGVILAAGAFVRGAEPTTQPASIGGKIIVEGEVPLSEMVVYLEPADASTPVAAPPKEVAKVSQRGAKFTPALTIISVGQTVEFLNDEDRLLEHNVFSNGPAKRFDLGMYPPGQSRSVTFDKPGPVLLYCSIHRYMDGAVYVSPTRYTSRVEPDATYRIDGVPPGKWVVKTWQRRRRFKEATAPVTVEAGQAANVNLELHKR